jgi:uncharacterized SAM-binding protein YcdF (DUF218 family)
MKWRSQSSFSKNILHWCGFALLALVTAAFVAWIAAEALIVRANLNHADALVVLGGSSTYRERTTRAAQLFAEGRASRILLTNDNIQSGYSAKEDRNPLFVELAFDELTRRGVPSDKIEIVPGSVSSTYHEAVRLRQYADEKKLRSILIVTSAYQSRRALWIIRRAFRASNIDIGLEPVEPGEQSPHPMTWWRYRLGWQMVPGEYVKIAYYRLKY